jgi:carbonic anhydrase
MYTRRAFVLTTAAASLASATAVHAQEACSVFTAARQQSTTPDGALQLLKDGNARFVSGKTINCDLLAQVRATSNAQAPFAAIVGCIDSRVPPELVFDQRIGDVFVARIAGNFVNDDIIGSLEFATKVAGAKAIVVLGHSECGAIKGGVDGAKLGLLTKMLENFNPAIEATRAVEGERSSKNKKLVQAVADMNATLAAKKLTDRSEVLRELVAQKQLVIAAAMHDIGTGTVKFL